MESYSSNISDYNIQIKLTNSENGIFGNVFLANYIPYSRHVALKRVCLEKCSFENFNVVCSELYVMRQFNHPNIHAIMHSFVFDTAVYIISPLYCFGSCKDTIQNCFKTGFPEILSSLILRDVLSAVAYMHKKGYIHGSIRASHILLNQRRAVLSSFREARNFFERGNRMKIFHGLQATSKDSINWLAPEVLEQNLSGYTEKSDIYSIGITSCELANGVHPFYEIQPTFMFTEKIRGNLPTLLDHSTWTITDDSLDLGIPVLKLYIKSIGMKGNCWYR